MPNILYDCGICGYCHPWGFDGDCRDDDSRFMPDEYAARLGVDEDALDIRSMEERVEADLDNGHKMC